MVFRGQDLWRRAPIFKYGFTDVLPGFREAVGIFSVYLIYDFVANKDDHHHGATGHSKTDIQHAASQAGTATKAATHH
jgi:hypothetical protein